MSRIPIVGDDFDFFISDADPEINLFCCSCGRVHALRFHKVSDGLWMTVSDRPRKTAQKRRWRGAEMLNGQDKRWEMRRRDAKDKNRVV